MGIPKVIGIEQEYAIQFKADTALSAFEASCMLINAYARSVGLREPGMRVLWDYAHESPYEDIRGRLFRKSVTRQVVSDDDNLLINVGLPNGARLYTDHAHPEYSTAECRSARQAIACDKAGEVVLRRAIAQLQRLCSEVEVTLYKNNCDHKGHSYGCHENYLLDATGHETNFTGDALSAMRILIPFLVTRQVFAGAGKVGGEAGHYRSEGFQISQRADFIENLFGLETTHARPIINTRAEHHADAKRFRRLHLILGDANMCEAAGFVKLGATQIVLQMIEDRFIDQAWTLKEPVDALRRISHQYDAAIELDDGRRMTAVQIQRQLLECAGVFAGTAGAAVIPEYGVILAHWGDLLDGLEQLKISPDFDIENDPGHLSKKLDWVLKLWLLNRYRRARNNSWDHPLLKVLDLQYHRVDSLEGLFYKLQRDEMTQRLCSEEQISHFADNAPDDTRAYFRSRCIQQYAREMLLLNWEVVGFDNGDVHRMVPLLNPLQGTREQFELLFDNAADSRALMAGLEAT
jgi:proteasome accessory factor A